MDRIADEVGVKYLKAICSPIAVVNTFLFEDSPTTYYLGSGSWLYGLYIVSPYTLAIPAGCFLTSLGLKVRNAIKYPMYR
ncbi:MAG: hypothetical protein AAB966_03085 [Patescibacteria group bacterium]